MMTSAYSVYLKDKQSHLYIDYVNNLYNILERLASEISSFPDNALFGRRRKG